MARIYDDTIKLKEVIPRKNSQQYIFDTITYFQKYNPYQSYGSTRDNLSFTEIHTVFHDDKPRKSVIRMHDYNTFVNNYNIHINVKSRSKHNNMDFVIEEHKNVYEYLILDNDEYIVFTKSNNIQFNLRKPWENDKYFPRHITITNKGRFFCHINKSHDNYSNIKFSYYVVDGFNSKNMENKQIDRTDFSNTSGFCIYKFNHPTNTNYINILNEIEKCHPVTALNIFMEFIEIDRAVNFKQNSLIQLHEQKLRQLTQEHTLQQEIQQKQTQELQQEVQQKIQQKQTHEQQTQIHQTQIQQLQRKIQQKQKTIFSLVSVVIVFIAIMLTIFYNM